MPSRRVKGALTQYGADAGRLGLPTFPAIATGIVYDRQSAGPGGDPRGRMSLVVGYKMDLTEFRIGGEFTTAEGSRRWRCTDVGTRTVAAIRIDEVEIATLVPGNPMATRIVPGPEAEAAGYFVGPPYKVAEYLFDEDDREGCKPA